MNIFVVICILVIASAAVSATMPNRRLGSYTKLDYSQENDKLYKPISRKAAFWMEFRVLVLLVAVVAIIALLGMWW